MAGAWLLSEVVTGSIWRTLIALGMGLGIAVFGFGFFSQMGQAPPEPAVETVPPEYQLTYVCEMCGLELEVVKVAKEKAPKHCGEEMVLIPGRRI